MSNRPLNPELLRASSLAQSQSDLRQLQAQQTAMLQMHLSVSTAAMAGMVDPWTTPTELEQRADIACKAADALLKNYGIVVRRIQPSPD